MENVLQALERVIEKLISDFQAAPNRFWNERAIHWTLFHYLKSEEVFQKPKTELIRAEFPTLKPFGQERPARGHYDLVVLQPDSAEYLDKVSTWHGWEGHLERVRLLAAVEVKLWLQRGKYERAAKIAGWR